MNRAPSNLRLFFTLTAAGTGTGTGSGLALSGRWLPLHDDCLLYGTLRRFSLTFLDVHRESPRESQTTNEFKKIPASIFLLLDINVFLLLTWEAFLSFFLLCCLTWSFHRVQPSSDSLLPVRAPKNKFDGKKMNHHQHHPPPAGG
jgi:hypothetical protein